jgi:hypothetical protein
MVRKQLSTQIRRDIPICTHRVLSGTPRERADETTQGKIDPWPPRPLSRLPAPEFLEARAVPPRDGLRLNDLGRAEQARLQPGHPDQQRMTG